MNLTAAGQPDIRLAEAYSIERMRACPQVLKRFLYAMVALAALYVTGLAVCRSMLHLADPYNAGVIRPVSAYGDFTMFFERFRHFHSRDFFTERDEQDIFSYPAPAAVLYKLSYVLTGESATLFAAGVGAVFVLAGVLFGRALLMARMASVPSIVLAGTAMLLSYPLWIELNRANIEIFAWIFASLGVWFFVREKGYSAALCLGIAGAIKLFPLVYLGLFVAKRQCRQVVFAAIVAMVLTLYSLWLLGPAAIGYTWHALNANMHAFGRAYLLDRHQETIGFDHSLFGLIRALAWGPLRKAGTEVRLAAYAVATAAGGIFMFFGRIRHLPVTNQLICLTVASVLLPPASYDYTLIHLYAPWAALVFFAIHAARIRRYVPGLSVAFACFAVLLSPQSEVIFHQQQVGGQIKAIALIVLGYVAAKYPFPTRSNTGRPEEAERLQSKIFLVA